MNEPSELGTGAALKCCALIPAYNEVAHIAGVVEAARRTGVEVVVVDDGSSDGTAEAAEGAGAHVLRQGRNGGKGAALEAGFAYTADAGYDVVITLDADGQHDPAEIPAFLEAYARTGYPVLAGNRMSDTSNMPFVRRYTNRFMSWLLSREMGQHVPDTQCGYRLYATEVLPQIRSDSRGFAAESEQLLQLAAKQVKIGSVPVKTIYGEEKSKINPIRDTFRFFAMLQRYRRMRSKA